MRTSAPRPFTGRDLVSGHGRKHSRDTWVDLRTAAGSSSASPTVPNQALEGAPVERWRRAEGPCMTRRLVTRTAAAWLAGLVVAGSLLAGCGADSATRHRRLRPGRSRWPVRGACLGRPDARSHPPGRAGADRPRAEPVPHVGRAMGRVGRLRPGRGRLPRHREALGRRRLVGRGRARDGDELRGLPHPAVALRDRGGPGDGPRAARRDHGQPVLPDGLRGDRR